VIAGEYGEWQGRNLYEEVHEDNSFRDISDTVLAAIADDPDFRPDLERKLDIRRRRNKDLLALPKSLESKVFGEDPAE
jgi:hypothetical protein